MEGGGENGFVHNHPAVGGSWDRTFFSRAFAVVGKMGTPPVYVRGG